MCYHKHVQTPLVQQRLHRIDINRFMKKILSHWSIAFVTLIALIYIGLQDPWVKEILRLKSFDYVLQNEEKTPSQAVTIVTIDEEAIEKHGQWPWDRDVLANLIL